MIKLKFAPNLLFQRLPDDNASTKTKNNSENNVNIEEQKIGQYSFAEGLWKDLTSATFRQFYNRLQLKLSVNSLKKKIFEPSDLIYSDMPGQASDSFQVSMCSNQKAQSHMRQINRQIYLHVTSWVLSDLKKV